MPEAPLRSFYKSVQLDSLWQRYHNRLTDPRACRGKRHRLATILIIAAAATVSGARGPRTANNYHPLVHPLLPSTVKPSRLLPVLMCFRHAEALARGSRPWRTPPSPTVVTNTCLPPGSPRRAAMQ